MTIKALSDQMAALTAKFDDNNNINDNNNNKNIPNRGGGPSPVILKDDYYKFKISDSIYRCQFCYNEKLLLEGPFETCL